jgi:gamma-glutamyl-gamma-aminobutyraldehyde dehydrogenase
LTKVSSASAIDVEKAVAVAREAFEDGRWSRLAPRHRAKVLLPSMFALPSVGLA